MKKTNLQMWIPEEFKSQLVKAAQENGYARWQTFCEIVLTRVVAGDIQLQPPRLVEKEIESNTKS